MKTCTKCGEEKETVEFAPSKRDGYDNLCRPCRRAYQNAWYAANRAKRRQQIGAADLERRLKNKALVLDYLSKNGCSDCSESDPVVLEFDHVADDKVANVADMYAYSTSRLFEEIAKCEVVCANCHRRRTAARGGHYRLKV